MVDTDVEDFLPQGHRLQILTAEEHELLRGFPRLKAAERKLLFSTTPREHRAFEHARTPRTQLHFRLCWATSKLVSASSSQTRTR